MSTYIKRPDGKMAGSIGDGKTKVPTPGPPKIQLSPSALPNSLPGLRLDLYYAQRKANEAALNASQEKPAYSRGVTSYKEYAVVDKNGKHLWGTVSSRAFAESFIENGQVNSNNELVKPAPGLDSGAQIIERTITANDWEPINNDNRWDIYSEYTVVGPDQKIVGGYYSFLGGAEEYIEEGAFNYDIDENGETDYDSWVQVRPKPPEGSFVVARKNTRSDWTPSLEEN